MLFTEFYVCKVGAFMKYDTQAGNDRRRTLGFEMIDG